MPGKTQFDTADEYQRNLIQFTQDVRMKRANVFCRPKLELSTNALAQESKHLEINLFNCTNVMRSPTKFSPIEI